MSGGWGPNPYNVAYAPNGSICHMNVNWGNTFTHIWTFNNRFQPVHIQQFGTGYGSSPTPCVASTDQPVGGFDLLYSFVDSNGHNNGNVASETRLSQESTVNYNYDSLNRLSSAQTTAINQPAFNGDTQYLQHCWAEAYSYDPWGNLYTMGPSSSSSYTGCIQESGFSSYATAKNQLGTYCYDAAGNLLLPTSTCPTGSFTPAYTYDAENHLLSVNGVNYTYDGDGKRVMKNPGKLYWYNTSGNVIVETDLSGNMLYHHYYFAGMRYARREPASGEYWFDHYGLDMLGNARFVYGLQGAWDLSDYYPFGGERVLGGYDQVGQPWKFTGKERDSESGLDNFGARYDSSSMGRFMSPDPLGGHQEDPQTLNKYAYVRNNPTTLTDPTGLHFWLQGGTACGLNNVTCDKKGYVLDSNNNRVLIGNTQLRDANSGDSANFDTNGVHITTAQGTFTGQFAAGTPDTRVEGAGDFGGMHAVFNSDCGGTCNAGGALFGTKAQFDALLPKLLKNPGMDNVDPFHPGTD